MSSRAKGTRSFVVLLLAAMLAACSSAGNVTPLTPGTQPISNSTTRASKGTLVLHIRVRRRKKTGHGPRYISAATQGMTMAFAGPSTFTQTINLTPSDPRCSGSPLVCTIDVALAVGSFTATVNTYDQAPVNGAIPAGANLLSTAQNVAFTVRRGIANHIGITLDGVPASISVGGFPTASAGTAFFNKSFSVTVKDADGYLIVGTYSTPITLTDSDTTGATEIATGGSDDPPSNELFSSSDTPTISYTGRPITPVTINASADGVIGDGIFAVLLPVYVAGADYTAVKVIAPGCAVVGCVSTIGGGLTGPEGVAVDASGNVFVADTGNNAVKEIPSGCFNAFCVTTLGGGFSVPFGIAIDGADDVWVGDSGNNAVKEIPAGCVTAGCVVTLGGGFSNPEGVAVDGTGDVFVADTGNNAVKEIPFGCSNAGCVSSLRGSYSIPRGVAVNGSGDVYVADSGHNEVDLVLHTCTRFCVIVLDGDFLNPAGVAVDGSDNLFVSDLGHAEVREFPAGCFLSSCSATLGGFFDKPVGLAVL